MYYSQAVFYTLLGTVLHNELCLASFSLENLQIEGLTFIFRFIYWKFQFFYLDISLLKFYEKERVSSFFNE